MGQSLLFLHTIEHPPNDKIVTPTQQLSKHECDSPYFVMTLSPSAYIAYSTLLYVHRHMDKNES